MDGGKPTASSEPQKGNSTKICIELKNASPEKIEQIKKKLQEVLAGDEFESLNRGGAGGRPAEIEVSGHSSHNDDDPWI